MTIATTENVAAGVTVEHGKVLSYLGLNPSDPRSQAVVAVAQRYDLDPLLKHVIVIPKGGVYITRDGLLHVAHRSGQLDGITVDQEPTLSEDGKEWVARVSVFRKDMRHPFTFPGRYPVSGSNREYPQEMALKAAEAHALRRAFDVSGLPALDERRPDEQPQSSGLASVLGDGPSVTAEQVHEPSGPAAPSAQGAPAANHTADGSEPAAGSESPLLDTRGALAKAMYAGINQAGIAEADRISFICEVIGRGIESTKQMTESEARRVLDHLPHALLADPAPEGGDRD